VQTGGNKQIIRAAWMLKRKDKGRGKVSGWKKRFVVLDVDTISYFKVGVCTSNFLFARDKACFSEMQSTDTFALEGTRSGSHRIV
jgi:hypothetical protein